MDWVAVSAIAGVFAAVFVALTAVYLSIQIRSSAQATQSQTYHLATSALAEMAAIVGRDKDLSRIFRIGMANPACGPEVEAAGGTYVPKDWPEAHVDGNLVTAPAWPAHPAWLAAFLKLL